jgi:hypothetical protein
MSGLPELIPPQSAPLLQQQEVAQKPQYMDVNWYLWAYNLSLAVLGNGQSGTTPASPYDLLDSANLYAQTSDIPQAYRQIDNLSMKLAMPALVDPTPQAAPAQSVTVGASPFTFQALSNGLLSVTGGAVSSVSIIRQGVTIATGITSASSSAITTFTDEKGSGGQPGFVAGVDFTPGTTTSLTLSQVYSSAADLWAAFDAGEQGANTYSLSGTTLTFNAAIPVGTQNVFVKGASSSTVSTTGGGLVPLRRLDEVQITYSSAPTIVFLPD